MNTDYGVNVVVFEVKVGRRLERALGERPTRAFHAATFSRAVEVASSFRRPPARRDWGRKPTEEFGRAVDEFWRSWAERERVNAAGVAAGARRRPRPPWWQYWDWPGEGRNPLTGRPR